MILLFDIDGTLVRVGGAGRRALNRGIEGVTGEPDALAGVRLDGGTDPGIIEAGFRAALGRPATAAEAERVLALYLGFLADELQTCADRYQVLPGVMRLLEAAEAGGRHLLGLATGNIEAGARLKLERGGLNRFFGFGGYGSDAAHRPDLVARGLERGRAQAERRLGRTVALAECWVVGDTELDVVAAHTAGARAIGVRVGSADVPALERARPELLVDTLEDPGLWSALSLAER